MVLLITRIKSSSETIITLGKAALQPQSQQGGRSCGCTDIFSVKTVKTVLSHRWSREAVTILPILEKQKVRNRGVACPSSRGWSSGISWIVVGAADGRPSSSYRVAVSWLPGHLYLSPNPLRPVLALADGYCQDSTFAEEGNYDVFVHALVHSSWFFLLFHRTRQWGKIQGGVGVSQVYGILLSAQDQSHPITKSFSTICLELGPRPDDVSLFQVPQMLRLGPSYTEKDPVNFQSGPHPSFPELSDSGLQKIPQCSVIIPKGRMFHIQRFCHLCSGSKF